MKYEPPYAHANNALPNSLPLLGNRLLRSITLPPRRSSPLPFPLTLLPRNSRTSHTLCTIQILRRHSSSLLSRILGNLVVILIKRLTRFFQLPLHTQQLLHTTELVRVPAQREPEIIDFDLLPARVVRDLRGAVAQFEDEVCDNFVQDANCFGEGFGGEGRVRAWVTVGEE